MKEIAVKSNDLSSALRGPAWWRREEPFDPLPPPTPHTHGKHIPLPRQINTETYAPRYTCAGHSLAFLLEKLPSLHVSSSMNSHISYRSAGTLLYISVLRQRLLCSPSWPGILNSASAAPRFWKARCVPLHAVRILHCRGSAAFGVTYVSNGHALNTTY